MTIQPLPPEALERLSPEERAEYLAHLEAMYWAEGKTSFAAFCRRIDVPGAPYDEPEPEVYYASKLNPSKHHDLIIDAVQKLADGTWHDVDGIICLAPPGSAKSTYTSVCAPAWLMGRKPGTNVIAGSYGQDLANRFGRRVRTVARSDEFSRIMGCTITGDNQAVDAWSLTSGSDYRAAGMGAAVTGFRADFGLLDDLIKGREDADSEVIREKSWNWLNDDFFTRLKPGGKVVIVMCMTGDTPVTMGDGSWKPLRDVRAGDEVRAYKNGVHVTRRVLNHTSQGLDTVYEIKTGHTKIKANARHPFLVEHPNGTREWVRVDDLKEPARWPCGGIKRPGDKIVVSRRDPITSPARVNGMEAWLLGYMFGDGWITVRDTVQKGTGAYTTKAGEKRVYASAMYPRRGYATHCAVTKDEAWNKVIADRFQSVFGVIPRRFRQGYFRTEIANIGRWFIDHGLTGNAKTKRVPLWMFAQPEEVRQSFLDGYNESDGHVVSGKSGAGRLSFASASEDLVRDMRQLARGLGYDVSNIASSKVMKIKAPNSPVAIDSQQHTFAYNPWSRTDAEFSGDVIRTIIKLPDQEEVFDLEVEDAECFIANGCVSHNTHWHEDDPAGRLLGEDWKGQSGLWRGTDGRLWHVINLPMLAEHKDDPLGRKPGEMLWPEWYRESEVKRLETQARKGGTAARTWSSLYQQRPAPAEGAILMRSYWRKWPKAEPPDCDFILLSYDTSFEDGEENDESAMTAWGIFPNVSRKSSGEEYHHHHAILLGGWADHVQAVDLADIIQEHYRQLKPDLVLVEKKASGITIVQELKRLRMPVKPWLPRGKPGTLGKVPRAHGVAMILEQGSVHYIAGRQNELTIDQCAAFPNGKQDGRVDTVTQALTFFRDRFMFRTADEEPDDIEIRDMMNARFEARKSGKARRLYGGEANPMRRPQNERRLYGGVAEVDRDEPAVKRMTDETRRRLYGG